MKINFYFPSFSLSGGVRVASFYGNELAKRGYKVRCYAPRFPQRPGQEHSVKKTFRSLRRYIMNSVHYEFLSTIRELFPFVEFCDVKNFKDVGIKSADVSIATSWSTAYYLNKLKMNSGKKVYFVQDFETWGDSVETKISLSTYAYDMKKIVISHWINKQLIANGFDEGEVIYNGMDTTLFSNANKKVHDPIRCLLLDHTGRHKGTKYGLAAFEEAKKYYPGLELVMFGMERSDIVPQEIEYHENIMGQELVNLYCSADIFIFPSINEGWGLTPVEAMACKCAVVGSSVGCMAEIGVNNKNALISRPKDVESMAGNIIRLCNDRDLLTKISENARLTAQELDWSNSVDKFERAIQK